MHVAQVTSSSSHEAPSAAPSPRKPHRPQRKPPGPASALLEMPQKLLWSSLTLVGLRRLEPLLPRSYGETTFYFKDLADAPCVALTIDDGLSRGGADASWVARVQALLKRHNAHATFFVCSQYLEGVEAEAARLVADGHELGNHLEADMHMHYHRLSEADFAAALARTTAQLEAVEGVGAGCVRWFRAPQAVLTARMARVVAAQGLQSALGDVYCDDWAMARSPRYVSRTMLRQVKHGSVCIAHMPEANFREHTLASLEGLLDGLSARGIACLTLSEMEERARQARAEGAAQEASPSAVQAVSQTEVV